MMKRWLKGVMPNELAEGMNGGLGWQSLRTDGRPVEWEIVTEQQDGDEWSIALRGKEDWSAVTAMMHIRLEPSFRAAIVTVALRNENDASSPPLTCVHPLSLRWSSPKHPILVRTVGGGMTYGFYPSPAYQERTMQFLSFGSEPITIESGPDGRSSNKDLPFLALSMGRAGVVTGMEWSGLWFMSVHSPFVSLTGGIPVSGLRLEAGETLELPSVHLVFFEGELDDGGNAFRRYLYERHCPKLNGELVLPPVSYDHWFGVGCDFDEAFMRRQVDRCAELGVEYFVLDAGWYAGCGRGGQFSTGVGNWLRVDAAKFPDGLEPLAEYVRSKGMRFGMWFEVERAHRQSDMACEHPDWFFDIGDDYLHLDLTKREVQDGIIDIISGWVRRLDVRWIRYDYNIGPKPFWEDADRTGKVQFRYVQGLYRVLDELMERHLDLLIECCASGGRRVDLGTLKRAHTIWFSDHTDEPHVCRFMQTGANRFLPGNLLNSAVPTHLGGGDLGRTTLDFVSRMVGAFSVDGDVASWSSELTLKVRRLVDIYKGFRHLLVKDFYPLTPHPKHPDEGEVVLFVSRAKDEAVLLAFRMPNEPTKRVVKLRGLSPDATYTVRNLLKEDAQVKPLRRKGEKLMTAGLALDLTEGCAVHQLSIRRC